MPLDDDIVKKSAVILVEFFNSLIKDYGKLCAKFTLGSIKNVTSEKMLVNDRTGDIRRAKYVTNYQLTVEVTPGGGIFQGIVWHNSHTDKYGVENDIDRINRYGNQSNCIDEVKLKPVCYCLNKL